MARGNEGWEFIKVGNTYQYKEDWFIAMIIILEDNSTDEYWEFKCQVEMANEEPFKEEFTFSHSKTEKGYYMGMIQVYEFPEYSCSNYKWKRKTE